MENIKCKYCGSIAVRRKGSEFCSIKCKNKYWNTQKPEKTDNDSKTNETQTLKNVSLSSNDDQEPPQRIKETFKTETFAYLVCLSKLNNRKNLQSKTNNELVEKKQNLERLESTSPLSSIVAGAIVGCTKGAIGVGIGALSGLLLEKFMESDSLNQKQKLNKDIIQLASQLILINNQIEDKKNELKSIQRFQLIERMIENPDYVAYQLRKKQELEQELLRKVEEEENKKKQEQQQLDRERQVQEERQRLIDEMESDDEGITVVEVSEVAAQPKHRIISSKELVRMKFPTLNFSGKWYDFLGKPETSSCIIIHGRPGSGKTSFTVIFSKYLALKFGKVIIVSKEEGFGETLKVKMKRFNAENDNIDIANFISLEQIYENIPQEEYNFIVLDSLNKLNIDTKALEKLRAHYNNSVIIAISQSTKDGKMRGSNEIIHDCDIEISVTNGIATTVKNRFQETGKEYKVF